MSQSILNMLYSHGVQSALPGEFSYRAFINNKIDLIEAEAISSLIHSSSEYSNGISKIIAPDRIRSRCS